MIFPAERFVSLADWVAWHGRHHDVVADRALAARPLANSDADHHGSCAPCLRATRFRAGCCDCPDRLDAPERAMLHASVAEAGLAGWARLAWLGPACVEFERAGALAGCVVTEAAEVALAGRLTAAPTQPLAAARRVLVDAGCLLALLDFDPEARRGHAGRLGWDLLDAARTAGFAQAEILRPWSRELGYFGDIFILKAVA